MNTETIVKPIDILLIEDNPGDVRLTIEALKEGKVYNNLSCAENGEDALNFLRKKGKYANAVRPNLIILDLNLPKKDGREVLKEVKEDPDLKRIPIVVLTSSSAEEDILKSYDLHANCYIKKPLDINQFINIVHSIKEFWFSIVLLPPKTRE